ncbi:MAG: hypothetical protein JW927_01770 [Deltaproteobacteria bacterium]|nr:hypothetical protein [Deltaproteobacteria bacterium]
MKQRRPQYHKSLVCIACMAFIFTFTIRVTLTKGEQDDISGNEIKPDLFTMDTLKSFGAFETKKFDKSLHDLHTDITGKECNTCHHVKGKEVSCRKCHKETDRKKLISMKNASHLSCIGCHREMSGPVNCSECHKANEQQKIVSGDDSSASTNPEPDIKHKGENRISSITDMNPVLFDHETHGQYQENCNLCHHTGESGSCTQTCHTVDGSKQGNVITAEQAMHGPDSKRSCIGCHEINKKNKECSGCHGFMENGKNFNEICLKCHMDIPESVDNKATKRGADTARNHKTQKPASEEILDKDIADVVIIDKLSAQYGAVELPHRQIIEALISGIKNNRLARHFHDGKETICLGCHHNSPSGKILGCAGCHSKTADDQDLSRPGLMVAYHQQCMGCHDRMGIESPESTGCVDCHKIKKAKTK